MLPLALAALLAAAPAPSRAGEPGRAPGGWSCEPAIDVRPLLGLALFNEPRRAIEVVAGPAQAAALPSPGHRRLAVFFLEQVCSRSETAVQALAKRLSARVMVSLPWECGGQTAFYPATRAILHHSFPPCDEDPEPALLHELSHAVFHAYGERHPRLREARRRDGGPGHDYRVYDLEDFTVLLAMDAETDPLTALDEGLAKAVATSLSPTGVADLPSWDWRSAIRNESQTESWRRKSWRQQQSNEYFVGTVLHEYLTPEFRVAISRLDRLEGAILRSGPTSLQQLVEGIVAEDPDHERDRFRAILERYNARWTPDG